MKRLYTLTLLFIFFATASFAQILTPVKWKFNIEKINDTEYKLKYTANIDKGWTVYSQFTEEDGPIPTTINYEEISGIELVGKATEKGAKKEGMDAYFGVNVVKFLADKPFVIEQKIKVKDASKPIKGYVNYMACDHEKCLPPSDVDFSFKLPKSGAVTEANDETSTTAETVTIPTTTDTTTNLEASTDTIGGAVAANSIGAIIIGDKIDQKIPSLTETFKKPLSTCGGVEEQKEGLFWTFLFGFIGGLLALLTPCVFPMLPITISFFTKDTKRKGWVNGLVYFKACGNGSLFICFAV